MSQIIFEEIKQADIPELSVIQSEGILAVYLNGNQLYVLEPEDKTNNRYVAVQLYLTHGIDQLKIAKAWKVTIRTINAWVAAYREFGLQGLKNDKQGRPQKLNKRTRSRIIKLRESNYKIPEIAQKVKLSTRSVKRVLDHSEVEQTEFHDFQESAAQAEAEELEELEQSTENNTVDPLNRCADRIAAYSGMLEDAQPIFADCQHVEGAGSLLAIAVVAGTGFFNAVQQVYRTIGPSFYGLRNIFMTLLFMALLRIKNPEQMNYNNPLKLGRVLGLDRAPSVKTIRRKLEVLGAREQAANLMNLRSKEIMQGENFPDAVLFVDGHVQCYHGQKKVGQTWSSSKNRVVKGMSDYWVNLADATPLLCIPTSFNQHLNKMLPQIIIQAQKSCPGRAITVVFDRGGAEGAAYELLIKLGCDFIAYHKNPKAFSSELFIKEETHINGRKYSHAPHERASEIPVYTKDSKGSRRKTTRNVNVREIIVRREDGRLTHVITTRKDLKATEACARLFSRWTQENFFKYMKETYNLDHLYTYRGSNVPKEIDHPNPEYTRLEKQRKKLRGRIVAILGKELENIATNKLEQLVKLHNGKKGTELKELAAKLKEIERALKLTPKRKTAADYAMLESERRLLGNLVKMTAWDAEGTLSRIVADACKAINGNERGMVAAFLSSTGSLKVCSNQLHITLQRQAEPSRTRLLEHLCKVITERQACYPGTSLKMIFEVAS
jgi:transposase